MTQEYTPVTWQDETTSQQGTLINAERLNQMQTAHHFADGFEEVDEIPTADPGVSYHKVVYCTADSTFYRWDGTEWSADIDDDTKRLLEQEIARATAAEGELAQDIADEETRATAAETALGNRVTAETSARTAADTALGGRIDAETTAREEADTELGADIGAETARARQAEQANAQAIANTYTKAEADTLLAAKADVATTYTKAETDTLLASKANDADVVKLTGTQYIFGIKTFDTRIVRYANTKPQDNASLTTNEYVPAIYINQLRNQTGTDVEDTTAWLEKIDNSSTQGVQIGLRVINSDGSRGTTYRLTLAHNTTNNTGYATAPNPGTGAPSNAVATLATLDAYAPMVRTSGNQTISGTKTNTNIHDGITRKSLFIRVATSEEQTAGNHWFKILEVPQGFKLKMEAYSRYSYWHAMIAGSNTLQSNIVIAKLGVWASKSNVLKACLNSTTNNWEVWVDSPNGNTGNGLTIDIEADPMGGSTDNANYATLSNNPTPAAEPTAGAVYSIADVII